MAGEPRKHHYVPQFYLAGFTKSDSKDGKLYVLDKEKRKTWTSTPKGTAHKRDFHAVEATPGGDPMAVEKALSQVEGQWSAALASVIDQKALPEGDSFGDLMMFVAFMAVRVPRIRGTITDFIDEVRQKQEFARKWAEQQGHRVQEANGHEFEVFDKTWHVQQMVQMAASLAPLLSQRKWCLWIANESAPDLICSDSPVAPTWAVPMPGPMSPAFGTPNTIVSVSLNRRIALVSMIEEELPATSLDRNGVAAVNSMTTMYANQLYSPRPDFVWTMADYRVGDAAQLLSALGEEKV